MLEQLDLTGDEREALEGDREAVTALAERLADTPTPAGPTPKELGTNDSFIPRPTSWRRSAIVPGRRPDHLDKPLRSHRWAADAPARNEPRTSAHAGAEPSLQPFPDVTLGLHRIALTHIHDHHVPSRRRQHTQGQFAFPAQVIDSGRQVADESRPRRTSELVDIPIGPPRTFALNRSLQGSFRVVPKEDDADPSRCHGIRYIVNDLGNRRLVMSPSHQRRDKGDQRIRHQHVHTVSSCLLDV
ncbi:hypothetical protein M2283_010132 [Streptomyces pseudovenezuelae]|uniref:Uncharacterized protein n=1 Tax=Streptomyces pseudovenezuelae TaxID=67350 RepID=A0ABT6M2K3_9ACTN|nr:hypothetical protein [Streptomyces pseudovenezuelae]